MNLFIKTVNGAWQPRVQSSMDKDISIINLGSLFWRVKFMLYLEASLDWALLMPQHFGCMNLFKIRRLIDLVMCFTTCSHISIYSLDT